MAFEEKPMKSSIFKRKRGFAIVESAAAICVVLPLIFLVIFSVLEISYAYMLRSSLDSAARNAARDLAVDYGQDPTIATSRTQQDSLVFDSIRMTNVIANSAQFDNPVFDTTDSPPTVSVT